MELTPEQREIIYQEVKAGKKNTKGSNFELLLIAAAAVIGFAGFLMLVERPARKVKIEDLRRAYDGLSPEEEL